MNPKNKLIVFAVLLLYILISGFSPVNSPKKKVVVIDAGHGGKDSGALGLNSVEKDIVLSIALKVGGYIEKNMPNVEVIYTRKTDVFIPLHERANIANKNNADLFVSIHANSNSNTKAYGTDSFVMGYHKTKGNLEVAKKENSVIVYEQDYNVRYEGFDPNSAESYIMFNMMTNVYMNQSLFIASFVQDEFRERAKRKDRGVKQAGFLVLWHTSMPSVLIETGFVSNPTEEKYLNSSQGQEYISSAIYRAVKKYINNLESEEEEVAGSSDSVSTITDATNNNIVDEIINDTILFRIQVLSSSKKLEGNSGIYNNYSDIYEYNENNTYKYALGSYTNIKQAKEYKKQIKNEYPDAFIVAFKGSERISVKEALNQNQ